MPAAALAAPLPARTPRTGRGAGSYLLKILAALLLVAAADGLLLPAIVDGPPVIGSVLGLFALFWLGLVALARRAVRHSRPAVLALVGTLACALMLLNDPGLLASALFLAGIVLTTLLPRAARFGDARRWAAALLLGLMSVPFRLLADGLRTVRFLRLHSRLKVLQLVALLALPAIGSAVFLALFIDANPILAGWAAAFVHLDLWRALADVTPLRVLFWLFVLLPVWSTLRPSPLAGLPHRSAMQGPPAPTPFTLRQSILLSLAAFNLVFALQNGLDIAFLWSGAPLPDGVTLADYAHRGAYPLIATALLAALFVLVTLRPGSDMAADRRIRRLVALWIGQNLVLVASAIERTATYVAAYQLTMLRLAAFIWMGLVAFGLVTIVWRILAGRSNAWLVNVNALAAVLVLIACAAVDLPERVADWNVSRQIAAGPERTVLDVGYLADLGPSALLPLIRAEAADLPVNLRGDVRRLRLRRMDALVCRQADWRGWTGRGALRLDAALSAIAGLPGRPDGESPLGCPRAILTTRAAT